MSEMQLFLQNVECVTYKNSVLTLQTRYQKQIEAVKSIHTSQSNDFINSQTYPEIAVVLFFPFYFFIFFFFLWHLDHAMKRYVI